MGQTNSPPEELAEFITLFNDSEYEESHAALLEAWQHDMANDFYKGLIQLAGALQHWASGNAFWSVDLLASSHNLLEKYAPRNEGLDIERLLNDIKECYKVAQRAKDSGSQSYDPKTMPQIRLTVVEVSP